MIDKLLCSCDNCRESNRAPLTSAFLPIEMGKDYDFKKAHEWVSFQLRCLESFVNMSLSRGSRIGSLFSGIVGPKEIANWNGCDCPDDIERFDSARLIDAICIHGREAEHLGYCQPSTHAWTSAAIEGLYSDVVVTCYVDPDNTSVQIIKPHDLYEWFHEDLERVPAIVNAYSAVPWNLLAARLTKEFALFSPAPTRSKGGRTPLDIEDWELTVLSAKYRGTIKRRDAATKLTGGDVVKFDNLYKRFKRAVESGRIVPEDAPTKDDQNLP